MKDLQNTNPPWWVRLLYITVLFFILMKIAYPSDDVDKAPIDKQECTPIIELDFGPQLPCLLKPDESNEDDKDNGDK